MNNIKLSPDARRAVNEISRLAHELEYVLELNAPMYGTPAFLRYKMSCWEVERSYILSRDAHIDRDMIACIMDRERPQVLESIRRRFGPFQEYPKYESLKQEILDKLESAIATLRAEKVETKMKGTSKWSLKSK